MRKADGYTAFPGYCLACGAPRIPVVDFDRNVTDFVPDDAPQVADQALVLCVECVQMAARQIGWVDGEKSREAVKQAKEADRLRKVAEGEVARLEKLIESTRGLVPVSKAEDTKARAVRAAERNGRNAALREIAELEREPEPAA